MSSDNLKLLTEWMPLAYTPGVVSESKIQNGGKIMLTGVLQRANTLNQNGRIYPKAILQREILNYQKFIAENRALGECDHPHVIRDARLDGDNVVGVIELLDTPSGKILQSLVESGITLGISSRGVGSTMTEGSTQIVQEDFQLICFDMVSEPSTPGAFMIREGREVSQSELDKIFTSSDKIDRIFNDILRW